MSGDLSATDFASLALLVALALMVLSFRRRSEPAGQQDDWLLKTRVEREAAESGQPALSLSLLEPAAGDGDPPAALPGDLALLRDLSDLPRPLSATDPAAAPVLMLLDPNAAIGEQAVEGRIDPVVGRWARLLVVALLLAVLVLRFMFG
jgi:hypothetical protein